MARRIVKFDEGGHRQLPLKSRLLQPPPPRFQCIYLPHDFIGETYVFALLRRKVCFCLMPVEQDHRAVIRESCFSLGGKMPEDQPVRLVLLSLGFN
jgi:hypothetical protein